MKAIHSLPLLLVLTACPPTVGPTDSESTGAQTTGGSTGSTSEPTPTSSSSEPESTSSTSTTLPTSTSGQDGSGEGPGPTETASTTDGESHEEMICKAYCITCRAPDQDTCLQGCLGFFGGKCDDAFTAYIECLGGQCGPDDCINESMAFDKCSGNGLQAARTMNHPLSPLK